VVICLEQGADLHMAQLMPLPLIVSCFSKIQIGFTFLVLADLGNPQKRAVKQVCVFFGSNSFLLAATNNSHGAPWSANYQTQVSSSWLKLFTADVCCKYNGNDWHLVVWCMGNIFGHIKVTLRCTQLVLGRVDVFRWKYHLST